MKRCARFAFGLIAIAALAAIRPACAAQRTVIVAAQYLTQPNSIYASPVWFGFHDGTFVTYQKGNMASAALSAFINAPTIQPMRDALLTLQADAVTDGLANPVLSYQPFDPGFPPVGQGVAREVVLDTVKNRFFSYLARVDPSDDAFVGNEDPNAIPVFDENGAFLGPIVIDIYGTQVLDAGVRQNDEQGLRFLDPSATEFFNPNATGMSSSPPENLPIRQHPGFNGSLRNPTGTPVRILGGSLGTPGVGPFYLHYDPVAADFTRPNFPILRLRITSGIDGDYSGNWYSPDRAGEGFSIQISNSSQPLIAIAWFTYAPDGSGTQVWLGGAAPLGYPTDTSSPVTVQMYQTKGGSFASTQNPVTVRRIAWGSITMGFSDCNNGVVYYQPTNPAFPSGVYFIQRVIPAWYPDKYKCADYSLVAPSPVPVP